VRRLGVTLIVRLLIFNTDYRDFLRWLYLQHTGLEDRRYEEQMRVRPGGAA
jgi:hypothetical protein